MERSLSPEEKWRRAEEIYYQRKRYEPKEIRNSTTINVQTDKDFSLFKKMIIQIILCISIYSIFYFIQNANDLFSQQVLNKTEEILSYDINFEQLYQDIMQLIETKNEIINNQNSDEIGKNLTNAVSILNVQPDEQVAETLSVSDGNNEEVQQKEEDKVEEEQSSLNQMEIDANEIKANYSIIKPLTGTITSRFGIRNPTTQTVPKYHTGIDIARADGSVIIAAMDGTVTLVSDYGDYRKSYKNNKWRCNDFICTLPNNLCKRRR